MKTNNTPFCDVCMLLGVQKVYDSSKHYTISDTQTQVFCSVSDGVTRAEFYEAAKAGYNLSLTVEVWQDEYQAQEALLYGPEGSEKRYNIRRTWPTGHGTLELYCEEAVK